MNQDKIFLDCEGDQWFSRNKEVLRAEKENDQIITMLKMLDLSVKSIVEVGCSNGWRLEKIRRELYSDAIYAGIDASKEAIEDGRKHFPLLNLQHSTLAEMNCEKKFDLLICNFVLHWVDRGSLLQSICNIDKLLAAGGVILLGDFYPDFNQKRRYHHFLKDRVYTYKQDYAQIFNATGLYKEIARFSYRHAAYSGNAEFCNSNERAVCVALQKQNLDEFYAEG